MLFGSLIVIDYLIFKIMAGSEFYLHLHVGQSSVNCKGAFGLGFLGKGKRIN